MPAHTHTHSHTLTHTHTNTHSHTLTQTHILVFLRSQDLSGGIRQISQFFGFPLTEEQVQTISAQSTFSAMKEDAVKTHGKFSTMLFRKGVLANANVNVHATANSGASRAEQGASFSKIMGLISMGQ